MKSPIFEPEMNIEIPMAKPQEEDTEWKCWSCGEVHRIKSPSHRCGDAPVYEKPMFEKADGMTFTMQIYDVFNGGKFCMQCSGCHGCR